MKRVLLLVVDGCTSRLLGPALEAGDLPGLADLAARGTLRLDCVSVFPSITPAATASIVTGHYPAAHGIAGMSWWNPSTGDISYFGDDVETILRRGLNDFLHGFLLRLNGERIQTPTMFELVERQHRRAACFNHLVFRGDVAHRVSPPWLLKLLPALWSDLTINGPSWLCLGDFVSQAAGRGLETTGGPFHRFGLDDQGTEGFLRELPAADALPDFSVAYFADYDFDAHQRGPVAALETLRRFDRRLGDILAAWGGVDRVLDTTCLMLTADHSHSVVDEGDTAGIDLRERLTGFRCADPIAGWQDGDEVMLCPNMRAAEVYVRGADRDAERRVCDSLLSEPRVDHVIWRDARDTGPDDFHVATRDRGTLRIRRAERTAQAVSDEYGALWRLDGELAALDLSVEDGRVRYGVYPNALERVANGVAHPRTGRLWVTARPGCEFSMTGQTVHHGAGSHGTLHELDSLVPLLIAGDDGRAVVSATPRIVDAVPLAAAVLGLSFGLQPGAPRA